MIGEKSYELGHERLDLLPSRACIWSHGLIAVIGLVGSPDDIRPQFSSQPTGVDNRLLHVWSDETHGGCNTTLIFSCDPALVGCYLGIELQELGSSISIP